ncbi:non-specific lipid-transfer protein-like protein At2g13820 [Eutrema salsugineum]|uniref:non-specific lipid-transfer protein-like protein At2g13820 n=1 Tax=Eutrema salsugineum TaxID=72664 RepID=UPI000CECF4B7|nr:non-specific lipid-transfer protein-like protein At2g13820 [Eutrema salsugineum]
MMNPTFLVLLVATVLNGEATTAQSGCSGTLISLSPCRDYITGGSSSPTSYCCTQFSTVVQSSPECLCLVVNSNDSSISGFNFNRTLALNLPTACDVQTPSASQCNAGSNGPTTSPAYSPVDSPQSALSPSGPKTFPWSNESTSNRNAIVLSLVSIALFLANI